MTRSSNFALLKDFAQETSSDKRRDLLRRATDVFLAEGRALSPDESAMLDELVSAVSADLSSQVRIELARKIAISPIPFNRTARAFASGLIDVARPVLEHSRALDDNDLIAVVENQSPEHLMAVTRRREIGERVSRALVENGDDGVVVSLLHNAQARLDDETYERVASRAETSTVLHAPFVRRKGVPLYLLNDVFLKVESGLRREILQKFEGVSPEDLEAAFERSRKRLSKAYGAMPADYDAAKRKIDDLARRKELGPATLATLLREGEAERTAFILAFARLADIDYEVVDRVVATSDLDALAMLCRAAGFDRALFVTLAMTIASKNSPMARVEEFGRLYQRVPLVAAQRAIRFWKVRTKV